MEWACLYERDQRRMLYGEVDGRSFFNAPALSGWWQAESVFSSLPVEWLIWKELQKRHGGGSPCPRPYDMHRFPSAVSRAAPSGRQWWRGRGGAGSEGMMVGHYNVAPQDRPPSTLHHSKVPLHLIIPSILICPSVLSSEALRNDMIVIMR